VGGGGYRLSFCPSPDVSQNQDSRAKSPSSTRHVGSAVQQGHAVPYLHPCVPHDRLAPLQWVVGLVLPGSMKAKVCVP
jgi:hypothetical protein